MKFRSVFDLLKSEPRAVIDRIYAGVSANDPNFSPALSLLALHESQPSQIPISESGIWACQAIFQSLSPVSKCLVFRILYMTKSFTLSDLRSLVVNTATYREASQELLQLAIIIEDTATTNHDNRKRHLDSGDILDLSSDDVEYLGISGSNADGTGKSHRETTCLYRVHPYFRIHLQQALSHPLQPWSKYMEANIPIIDCSPPSIDFLNENSRRIWNSDVLAYLLTVVKGDSLKDTTIDNYLRKSNLLTMIMSESNNNGISTKKYMITSKGYEYMLKDYSHQIWDFLLYTLEESTNSNQREEILLLIFMLSYTEVGKAYPIQALTDIQKTIIRQFVDVGIVYMRSKNAQLFYPSHTAVNMLFGISLTNTNDGNVMSLKGDKLNNNNNNTLSTIGNIVEVKEYELQIIVETNLQVTAYLTTDLHLALLELFVKVQVRLPNMAFGRLMRDKVKDAYKAGIQAVQIIDFLQHHAHPIVQNNRPILPPNVTDQLILWENELQRVTYTPASYRDLSSIMNVATFQGVVAELERRGVLLWASDPNSTGNSNDKRLMIVVSRDGEVAFQQLLQRAFKK